ncbi:hypothetical protein K0T92_06125 [Paenibacillus oenotherae]|uniref:HNH endonuclease 5 domain-containing protein n=1 Tax=Paenibacillus oenotherae TaxID=1435645 RepID=A0ABS7D310_9BACL|nr:hypothetical protein [Paenibacillus oenotherae]MBW7474314.1 hypothetical protein [Paenibacillus oenotherae]
MIDHKYSIPTPQRWETCFYCGGHLPAKNKEHIFNSNWTGKHKTGSLICDVCNAAFAPEVDKAFLPYTKYQMNVWSLKGERHKDAPTIKTKEKIVIRPGAQPEVTPSLNLHIEDGKLYYKGKAPNKATLRRLLNDQLPLKLGRSLREDEIQQINISVRQAEIHTELAGSVQLHDSIDPSLEMRSTIHTILKCMALYDPKFREHIFKDVLDFSRYGIGDWSSFAVQTHSIVVDVVAAYSKNNPDYNAVEVHYLPANKQILARLVILGQINRWVILSNEYEGPFQLLFVGEPSLGGILEPLFLTFADSFPLSVQVDRVMVIDDFAKELVQLSQIALGPDAQLANLFRCIEQILKGKSHVTVELIEEYRDALLSFITNMGKIQSQITGSFISYSEEDMLRDLMDNGLAELEALIGQSIVSPKVAELITRPILFVFSRLIQLGKEAKSRREDP